MGSVFGRKFRAMTFGESHGAGVGVVLEGVPAGLALSAGDVQRDLDRRRPGASDMTTARKEADRVEIVSGLAGGRTLGTPICMLVRNTDARSKDYGDLLSKFRPGHADYTYFVKYGITPQPGGGRSSGRETVGRVAAGAVARALLKPLGVHVQAYTVQVGGVEARRVDPEFAETHPLKAADPDLAEAMVEEVRRARAEGDSVGGRLELVARGVPAGLGDPVFDKLDALLGGAMLSIGGIKGVEIGAGFAVCGRRGSGNNDPMDEHGFLSNHAGGILGGISTGEPIVLGLAVKPTPSIAQPQRTRGVDGGAVTVEIKGRHDPCLCPRIAPVAEAMCLMVLADCHLLGSARLEARPED